MDSTTRYAANATDPPESDTASMSDLLRNFTVPEKIDECYCSKCKDHTASLRTHRIRKLPNILIASFKRMESNGRSARKKDMHVDFPLDGLDLSSISLPYKPEEAGSMAGGPVSPLYDLFGVVHHYGRMGYGHYTSCCRSWTGGEPGAQGEMDEEWWSFDDGAVEKVKDADEIVNKHAYMLFYRRKVFT
mmetsp:Transcript_4478/g.9340  ORF Transcript_4478/g.9340 Transcript_4478/m.9340 type:complete len:189 (+) Transcript_4478:105-671(+)